MEKVRLVIGVVVGIILIIILVLLARWAGDRIRERFLVAKPAKSIVVNDPNKIPASNLLAPNNQINNPATIDSKAQNKPKNNPVVISKIPSTGPEDLGYFLIGFSLLCGLSLSKLAKRIV